MTRRRQLWLHAVLCLHSAFCIVHLSVAVTAQQLIDRVLARVGTKAVTLTDVRAAIGLGLVTTRAGEDIKAVALQQTIDRELLLNEVARFSPPEPTAAAVAEELARMKAHAGAELEALAMSTGLDEPTLQQLARETLRIRAYIAQRFGTSVQVTEDEARKYYEEHPDEFTREGVRMSFEEAEAAARQRVSAVRLGATIDQWTRDLRSRSEVVIVAAQ
jgi:hypothetical protein